MESKHPSEKPIFILGAHKSGTSFLRALFDGHLDLQVVPIEAHYFQHLGLAISNAIRPSTALKFSSEGFNQSILQLLEQYNNSYDNFSDSQFSSKIDLDLAASMLDANKGVRSPRECLQKINETIFCSVANEKVDLKKRIVEKSVENFEFAAYLKIIFPDAYFIHIVRDPYQNLASLVRANKQNYLKLAKTIQRSFQFAINNSKIIENYKIIRYEDLVSNLECEMKNLAEFLEIEFSSKLLKPTILGQAWQSNSTRNVSEARSFISVEHRVVDLEVIYINKFLNDYLEVFKYKRRLPSKFLFIFQKSSVSFLMHCKNLMMLCFLKFCK